MVLTVGLEGLLKLAPNPLFKLKLWVSLVLKLSTVYLTISKIPISQILIVSALTTMITNYEYLFIKINVGKPYIFILRKLALFFRFSLVSIVDWYYWKSNQTYDVTFKR